jgi:enoyl-CoA hydratase
MERKTLKRVIYEKDPPIARIIMNHPEKANVQDEPMVWDVDSCLTEAEKDWDIKVVILKANGRGFCAGHPMRPMPGTASIYPSMEGRGGWKPLNDLFLWPVLHLWECQKPTISQVHGYCLGGGTYFAYFTDITICSDDAYFQMPLVQGLGAPGGNTCVEPWIFWNWKLAARYLYTAQTVTAQEAYRLGLVNEIVSRDQLEAFVDDMARLIAQAPLTTLLRTKANIRRAWDARGMRTQLENSADIFMSGGNDPERQRFQEERQKLARGYPRDFAAVQAAKATQKSG